MSILVVDDSKLAQEIFESYLSEAGYEETKTVSSAEEALRLLDSHEASKVDLVLMDILMPRMNGIEACRLIKQDERFKDLPIIIISGMEEMGQLDAAFLAGASDFITKPVNKIELLARVRSALNLKHEMDERKAREALLVSLTEQLEELNRKLQDLSNRDGLTAIANRRSLDEFAQREWKRGMRDQRPISIIMIDIDFFKAYNDTYGHQAGDDCLKLVAKALENVVKRPGDIIARYGGEEFVAVLTDTTVTGAAKMAESMRQEISSLAIRHAASTVADMVTISVGVASRIPPPDSSVDSLLAAADAALYRAKRAGRNRIEVAN